MRRIARRHHLVCSMCAERRVDDRATGGLGKKELIWKVARSQNTDIATTNSKTQRDPECYHSHGMRDRRCQSQVEQSKSSGVLAQRSGGEVAVHVEPTRVPDRRGVGCPRGGRDGDERRVWSAAGGCCNGEMAATPGGRLGRAGRWCRRAGAQSGGVEGCGGCWCGRVASSSASKARIARAPGTRAPSQGALDGLAGSGRVCDDASAVRRGSRARGGARNAGARVWWCRR